MGLEQLRDSIRRQALAGEAGLVEELIATVKLSRTERFALTASTTNLVERLRREGKPSFLQSFLAEYGLSTEEGVALMSMAEAFLRVPDADTLDELIAEKISRSNWQSHSGQGASFLVNASTWALLLSGRLLTDAQHDSLIPTMRAVAKRLGEPVMRVAMAEAMVQLGKHFVVGETITHAMSRIQKDSRYTDYCFSFDMLGEAAITAADAANYFVSYRHTLQELAAIAGEDIRCNSGISVKLSALHPRFELLQKRRCFEPLVSHMTELAELAKDANLNLNIDGEDASSLELTLDVFEALARLPGHRDWSGLGLVVQAYSRNAPRIIDWLRTLAEETGRHFMIRLVKGAYWDSEIKQAQVQGLQSYPVFTQKAYTDVSYLACARMLMEAGDRLYPMFATHNAHSVTAVLALAERLGVDSSRFELQRLYGMGEDLHEFIRRQHGTRHRIYAPVGEHEDLLAYLVRRLLENGANSSFVHQLTDSSVPAQSIAADPLADAEAERVRSPVLASPADLYAPRQNSTAPDLANEADLAALERERGRWQTSRWWAVPLVVTRSGSATPQPVFNPAQPGDCVGEVEYASAKELAAAVQTASAAVAQWSAEPVERRAVLLRAAADLLADNLGELAALLTREAGKTMVDVIGEWREAIDFLRYYADQACDGDSLNERNARGVVACIAPWNFPLSIFLGQISAALAAGNTVLAKPAEQATLVAWRATSLLHQAGIPREVLQLLPGPGESVGAALVRQAGISGVCFTGSTEVATLINRSMAQHGRPDARLIAETGGINAMIVDSTALPEQTVQDIVTSAFVSAGQRCSALRIVYLQSEIADRFISMLIGAMDTLQIGDPWHRDTDVGPVIDAGAQADLQSYIDQHDCLHRLAAPSQGHFVGPALIEVGGIEDIPREVFGPVLHLARFTGAELDQVIDSINAAGYGLTAAVHSRLTERVDRTIERLQVGNIYVNRNQIGAVVESQPFGGQGLSGTGPKAGGPLYLHGLTAPAVPHSSTFGEGGLMPINGERLQAEWRDLQQTEWSGERCLDWQNRDERLGLLQQAWPQSKSLSACRIPLQRQMRGPTGERNVYQLRPVGPCLCLGPDVHSALEQAMQALAFGNPVLVFALKNAEAEAALAALQRQNAPLRWLASSLPPEFLATLKPLAAVSFCGDQEKATDIRRSLAIRPGPILRFIHEPIDPAGYVSEVHVCNDVTSTGGNVELMTSLVRLVE